MSGAERSRRRADQPQRENRHFIRRWRTDFHVFGSIARFERRLIAERTKDGIAAARAKGKLPGRRPLYPEKASAALKLVEARVSPTEAAPQLGRATIYQEMALAGVRRTA